MDTINTIMILTCDRTVGVHSAICLVHCQSLQLSPMDTETYSATDSTEMHF